MTENQTTDAQARCISPNCPTTCSQCNCAIDTADTTAMLVADLLEDVVAGDGGPYEDGEHPVVDRARAFLQSRSLGATDAMIDAACEAVPGLYRVDAMRAIESALAVA